MADKTPAHYLLFNAQGATIGGGFTPDGTLPQGAMVCTPAQARAAHAWRLQGGQLVAAAVTAGDLIAYANAKQWALATGGYTLTVGGQALRFATDPESQFLITGKAVRFGQPAAPPSVDWQIGGGFVTLQAVDFMASAVAIADFIQATFDTLKTVLAGIAGGAIATTAAIDAAAWPAAVKAP